MISFLKTCLKGFLTIILSPCWLAFFLLYFVYSIFLFFYTSIKCLCELISHRSHGIYDTEFDKRAKEVLSNPNFNLYTRSSSPIADKLRNEAPFPVPPSTYQPPQYPPQYPPYYPPDNNPGNNNGGNNQ